MRFEATEIAGLWAVRLERHEDARGSFARTFCRQEFAAHHLVVDFLQASLSVTRMAGTLRGMHYQRPPYAEVKLVRCVRGAIYDVVADLRPSSASYMRWQAFMLEPSGDLSLYIPAGCAHGFQTLADDTEVLYQMSAVHAPAYADGFRFDDPALEIAWPRQVTSIADKDLAWPRLRPSQPGA
jgi:dTDP-4-dehydrorhamnose 3,5-epimerase